MIMYMQKKKVTCQACGNNPTNHPIAWVSNTLSVLLEPLDRVILGSLLGRITDALLRYATKPYLYTLQTCRLISWNQDKEKALTKRSYVVWEEAEKRGIHMEQLVILKRPVEFYRARIHNTMIYFESIPQTKKGYIDSLTWMDDKLLLKKKLRAQHIPTPKGGSAYTYRKAKELFEKSTHPVIIKPRIGSRGRHTTTHIYTLEDLRKAYTSAKKLCFFVIIEEHLIGSVYRGTCVNNQLYGVLEGSPPQITGNGTASIKELIELKNKTCSGTPIKEVVINDALHRFLERLGYTLDSIIPNGKTIDLSEKIGLSYGGSSRELFDSTHPKIKAYLNKAATLVDAGVIGFDFIVNDPTQDPDTQTWGIIECNSLPFINLHHDPLYGNPISIAKIIWDTIEKN